MPPFKLPTQIDRTTLRMITIKRFVTAASSLALALVLCGYGINKWALLGAESKFYWVLALVVFSAGGAWSLRDALRGRRMLRGE